ncbi:MAG: hypothetical protein ACTIJJ_09570 [Galactobacter sp.]
MTQVDDEPYRGGHQRGGTAAALSHGLTLAARDARARPTYEAIGVEVEIVRE